MTITDKLAAFITGCCIGYFLAHVVWMLVR